MTSAFGVLFPIVGKRYFRMRKGVFNFAKCVDVTSLLAHPPARGSSVVLLTPNHRT